MEIFLLWLVFSVVVAIGAGARGRSGLGWFVLSMLFSPLLALILLLLLPRVETFEQRMARLRESGVPTPETHVKCPDCRELVLVDARKCKHCGCRLVPMGELPEGTSST